MQIRLARPTDDAAAVAEIYRPVVETTAISFEELAPSPEEMEQRMQQTMRWSPWLVAEVDGEVTGYAYATSHRSRAAYLWSVDVSVYVGENRRGKGVGRALYDELLGLLRRQGFFNVYAGVTLPNPVSVALHRAIGMQPIGVYPEVGYKFGRWWDVMWLGMRIAPSSGPVEEPVPLPPYPSLIALNVVRFPEPPEGLTRLVAPRG